MIDLIDALAAESTANYQTFQRMLKDTVRLAFMTTSISRVAQLRIANQLDHLANTFVSDERYRLETSLKRVHSETEIRLRNDTGNSEALLVDYQSEFIETLVSNLRSQIRTDAQSAKNMVRNFTIEANILARKQGVSFGQAAQHLKANQSKSLAFSYIDRANRKIPADRFWNLTVRLNFIRYSIMPYIESASILGFDKFIVRSEQGASKSEGRVLEIGSDKATSAVEFVEEVFHPNSRSTLEIFDGVQA